MDPGTAGDLAVVRDLAPGRNQRGARDHNERLVLSTVQRHGRLSAGEIARRSGLSAQTISVIVRKLEQDGLLARGEPVRGRVGKPSVPLALDPGGVLSVGLKIGRRSADLVLTDFTGAARAQVQATYRYPMPGPVTDFLRRGLAQLTADLSSEARVRIAGIGIARPYEIWNWHETVGAPDGALSAWRDFDLPGAVAGFTALPLWLENDATAACRAEHLLGRGRAFRDYAYLFVGAFVGGGVVLDHAVHEGRRGNAGAFGSLLVTGADGQSCQLIDAASLHLLDARLAEAGIDPACLTEAGGAWDAFPDFLERWIADTAQALARAVPAICAVIDFEAVLIDGAFPAAVRARLVERTAEAARRIDMRGLHPPLIVAGTVGWNARALGAAAAPVIAQYLLGT